MTFMAKNRLFWISFLVLFVEMASLRWLNASVTILAYFNNLVLISCFFGLGVGCLLAPRKISLIHWYPFAFLALVVVVVLLNKHGIEISYKEDVIFVSMSNTTRKASPRYRCPLCSDFSLTWGCSPSSGKSWEDRSKRSVIFEGLRARHRRHHMWHAVFRRLGLGRGATPCMVSSRRP